MSFNEPRADNASNVPPLSSQEYKTWIESAVLPSAIQNEPILKFQQPISQWQKPHAIIICGPRAAGKTTISSLIAHGLGSQAANSAWIPTELAGASTKTDLFRMQKSNQIVQAIGIEGCACCAAVDEVMNAVEKFEAQGRKLIIIEISTHSNAAALATQLHKQFKVASAIVMLQRPDQLESFNHDRWLQARAACAVLVTNNSPDDPKYLENHKAVCSYVESVPSMWGQKRPVIASAAGFEGLKQVMDTVENTWGLIETEGLVKIGATMSLDPNANKDRKADLDRKTDYKYYNEVRLNLYDGVTTEKILSELSKCTDSFGLPTVERGKGFIDGYEVNFSRTDNGLKLEDTTGNPDPMSAFGHSNYIAVASTDRLFLERNLGRLAVSLGMMADLAEETVNEIRQAYPSKAALEEAFENTLQESLLGKHTSEPLITYTEDRHLTNFLRVCDYLLQSDGEKIPDEQTAQDFYFTTVDLATEWYRLRADLIQILDDPRFSHIPKITEWMITTSFLACQALYHQKMIQLTIPLQDELYKAASELDSLDPFLKLLNALSKTDKLIINNETELQEGDLYAFRYSALFAKQKAQQDLNFRTKLLECSNDAKANIQTLIKNSTPEDKKIKTWGNLLAVLDF